MWDEWITNLWHTLTKMITNSSHTHKEMITNSWHTLTKMITNSSHT